MGDLQKKIRSAPLSIGVLAKEAGCQVQTVRYYEQIRILPRAGRTEGGHRLYSEKDLQRLRFVCRSRELGFSLKAVRELLRLADSRESDCGAVDKIASEHLTDVRAKLAQLAAMEHELKRMATGCRRGKISNCRIIQSLSNVIGVDVSARK